MKWFVWHPRHVSFGFSSIPSRTIFIYFLCMRKDIPSTLTGAATVLDLIHFVSGNVPAFAAKHPHILATSHSSVCSAHQFVFCTVSVLCLHIFVHRMRLLWQLGSVEAQDLFVAEDKFLGRPQHDDATQGRCFTSE